VPAGGHTATVAVNVVKPTEASELRFRNEVLPVLTKVGCNTGGQRIDPKGEGYQLLVKWLKSGAVKDPADTPKPVGIEVSPKQVVFGAAACVPARCSSDGCSST
jgi:hypothetical protein